MQSIQSLLEVCNHASKEANESIKDLVGKRKAYQSVYIGADGTRTRLIDDRAEKAIFEVLKSYGNCRILSEEYGEYIPDKKPEITFVIDPLDGTYNAAHGIPFYSTSIAVGNADLSSIYFGYVKNLCTGDIYHAYKGGGAYLNGEPINTSTRKLLKNFSVSLYGYHNNVEHTLELSRKVRRVRILGSVALELCYVACGKLDAFVDIRNSLRLIDVAAGKLILEETNGMVTNGKGTELHLQDSVVNRLSMIASNGHAHRDILNFVGRKDESK